MISTSWASPSCHRKQIRHWSLIRMLCCPARSPRSALSLLFGGTRRSRRICALFSIRSFLRATCWISVGTAHSEPALQDAPNHAPTAPISTGQTQVCGIFCCMGSPHSANKRDNATVVQVAPSWHQLNDPKVDVAVDHFEVEPGERPSYVPNRSHSAEACSSFVCCFSYTSSWLPQLTVTYAFGPLSAS